MTTVVTMRRLSPVGVGTAYLVAALVVAGPCFDLFAGGVLTIYALRRGSIVDLRPTDERDTQ